MSYSNFLRDCNVSEKVGFVLENPVTQLDETKFHEWIDLCRQITTGADSESVCRTLDTIGHFDTSALTSHEEQRYAKLLLETITQGFLYMGINAYEGEDLSKVPDRLPSSLARPLIEVSELLGMMPVISHGSIALANVKLAKGKENVEFIAENLDVIMPRTHLKNADIEGYNWFFQVTCEIEACFARSIHTIGLACFENNNNNNNTDLHNALNVIIDDCQRAKQAFKKYRLRLSPRVFYHEIRPCLWGYDQLPKGLKLGESEEAVKYRGASASESSALQVVDAFLGVTYNDMQKGFFHANRKFMPKGHRKFIGFIEESIKKEGGVLARRVQGENLFPAAMRALKELRSEHVNLVTLFVAGQMKNVANVPVSPAKMLIGFLKSFRDACVVQENEERSEQN